MILRTPTYITDPKGIDSVIQEMQTHLSDNISWLSNAFGRAYKNNNKPEVYNILTSDYEDVFAIDFSNAMCFFNPSETINYENDRFTTNIDIIFFIRLDKCFPVLNYRCDEVAVLTILDSITTSYTNLASWQLNTIVRGAENVYSDFNFVSNKALVDSNKYFVVKFQFSVNYFNNLNC